MATPAYDAKTLLNFWLEVIDADAQLAESMAKAEQRAGLQFDANMFARPEIMASLVARSKVEDVGSFFKFILEVNQFTPKLSTLMTLKTEEKLQLAKELRGIIGKYREEPKSKGR